MTTRNCGKRKSSVKIKISHLLIMVTPFLFISCDGSVESNASNLLSLLNNYSKQRFIYYVLQEGSIQL